MGVLWARSNFGPFLFERRRNTHVRGIELNIATATLPVPTTVVETSVVTPAEHELPSVARYCVGQGCELIKRTEDGPWEAIPEDMVISSESMMGPFCTKCKRTIEERMPDVLHASNRRERRSRC